MIFSGRLEQGFLRRDRKSIQRLDDSFLAGRFGATGDSGFDPADGGLTQTGSGCQLSLGNVPPFPHPPNGHTEQGFRIHPFASP